MRELPPEIGNLTDLKILSLSYNHLTRLPSSIGNLTNLETLWLNNNQLTELPPEIGNLKNLKELDLSGNPFNAPQQVIDRGDWAILEYYSTAQITGMDQFPSR